MNCMQTQMKFAATAAILGLSSLLHAADFHASPEGAGSKDGSSKANAVAADGIGGLFNDKMQAGDRLLLAAGIYKTSLTLSNGGTADKPKTIEGPTGSETATFQSSWTIDKPDKGATAFNLGAGLTGVTLKNLHISHYCFAIRAGVSTEKPRTNLTFDNISMEQMRHGFYLSDCDSLLFTNCTMKRYSKHGFRFDQGCDKVVLKGCVADCSEGDLDWETKTELFTFGFIMNNSGAPNTGFLFENCVAKNNMKSNQGKLKYTNGDGFVGEANTRDVTFRNCHAIRNQDGGFDLKIPEVKLIDCIAIGHRRDFRVWKEGTLENCTGGWSTTGFWGKGGPVTATNCLFIAERRGGVEMEGGAVAPITLKGSTITTDSSQKEFQAFIGKVEKGDTKVVPTEQVQKDPRYIKVVELGKPLKVGPAS